MKILLIGDPFGVQDIGERKVVKSIYEKLQINNEVLVCKPDEILKFWFLKKIKKYKPDIIHYWAGPRTRSFFILWLFKLFSGCKKTFLTAIRPQLSVISLFLSEFIKPKLIFAQSSYYKNIFDKFGYPTVSFPNGIDTKKFSPVDENRKTILRAKYNVPIDKFIVTHVGHITPWRSLEIFEQIAKDKRYYILIIASTSLFNPDEWVLEKLIQSGCDVRTKQIEDIEEIYQLSDCYVFPGGISSNQKLPIFFAKKKNVPAIEIPLSVLEAMSCDIPIITSKFGGLTDIIQEGSGVYFIDRHDDIINQLTNISSNSKIVGNRKGILKYDWNYLYDQLIYYYQRS